MNIRIGVIMDPISTIIPHKDSTFAIMLAAQKRGWPVYYFQQHDLFYKNHEVYGKATLIKLFDRAEHCFEIISEEVIPLSQLQILIMRKDPPVDRKFIYTTYMLELCQKKGVLVVNDPKALRDVNEKFFTTHFTKCTPETMIAANKDQLIEFIKQFKDVILKPLYGMGGYGVFRMRDTDPNISVTLEMLTQQYQEPIMAQRYIAEVKNGDKRIILIDGVPIPYALVRIPAENETRANLATGASYVSSKLSDRDIYICNHLSKALQKHHLYFVGIDVIGDYLTEINVTSPTGIRQLDKLHSLDIASQLLDVLTTKYHNMREHHV